MTKPLTLLFAVVGSCLLSFAQEPPRKMGHSRHGSAFDSGLRTRPWPMSGIGQTHFPITTDKPEMQAYFDQANTLMHNFWWEEAERSLRWCHKLDPEHPMVYWALSLTGDPGSGRHRTFLDEAIKRKYRVSVREQAYISAWEAAYKKGVGSPDPILRRELQKIVLAYPDDVEAKARLAWVTPEKGTEFMHSLLVRQIQSANPLHPGAIHSNIHAWDYAEPAQAIDSALKYAKAVPKVGHALHMPGHIFAKVGMWHEAARAMDSATRTELRYLQDRFAMPFETWNFQHNRNYLSYIQEQLGMAKLALQGARDLLDSPTDPDGNNLNGGGFVHQGREAFIRGCLKFERYDLLVKPGAVPFGPDDFETMQRHLMETLAHAGLGDALKSRPSLEKLKAAVTKMGPVGAAASTMVKVAEYRVLLAEDKPQEALAALREAELSEERDRLREPISGDPPFAPWTVARLLGDELRRNGSAKAAIPLYEKGLRYEPNDAFALAGLAMAHHAVGDLQAAAKAAGKLEYVWSGADPGLRWMQEVRALKLGAKPIAETPRPERRYVHEELASYGPSNWTPFPSPKLECVDSNGKSVRLADLKGRNVLLIFYLSDTCVHCVEQLAKVNEQLPEFEKLNTTVLAVSGQTPEQNRESLKVGQMKLRLLSDRNHENARRFASYDDFEDMELHSTTLIDRDGRVRWKRTGGEPFMKVDYLLREIRRWNGG